MFFPSLLIEFTFKFFHPVMQIYIEKYKKQSSYSPEQNTQIYIIEISKKKKACCVK
jgi:hypothetical protein